MSHNARLTLAFSMLITLAIRPVTPQHVPCFFIFGDSLVDNGNNNDILTLARANYYPYGVDFPQGSTGRFTNGRTTVDFLCIASSCFFILCFCQQTYIISLVCMYAARLLGFRHFIPSYATAHKSKVLRGLNFASGAAGIREDTGNNLGQHYHFAEQVEHFGNTVLYITRMFRGNTSRVVNHLSKCIYFAGLGSNDYLNNYFMPNMYPSSYDFSPKTYASLLLEDYSRRLAQLYDLGARKVAVVGVGQIGCTPYELARLEQDGSQKGRRCNDSTNKVIAMYNSGLVRMVRRFNSELPGAKFVYVNTFESGKDLVNNAASYGAGFEVIDRGCCGVGRSNGLITCLPLQMPCEDRHKYLFWDSFHPTEVANHIYARKAYYSNSSSDVYPMNLRQLAMA